MDERSNLNQLFDEAQSLDPEDRLRLIARLWASLPENYFEERGSTAPPEPWPVSPKPMHLEALSGLVEARGLADMTVAFARGLFSPPATPLKEKIYSAPRRFDLATIFVVTFAYSLLFGVMSYVTNYLEFNRSFSLFVGAFITLVGVGQAALYGGQNARVASLLVGAVLCVLWNFVGVLWPPRGFSGIGLFFLVPFSAAFGAGFGYMAGALVGGVFLVADKLRNYFAARKRDSSDVQIESDEVDVDEESHVTI